MYRKFYGLKQQPFQLAPAWDIVYLSESHKEGLATLRYGVISDKGFLLLTGGVGSGKTTLLNHLVNMLYGKVQVCVLNNPTLRRDEFFHYIGEQLGFDYKGNKSKFISQFSHHLNKYENLKGKVLLIIDEAQAFPIELLEEIRLLSNHASERSVFSIFLIGQPELQEKLAHPQLLPLRQRIGIRYHLEPLTREDTAQYISFRLNKAGAINSAIFTTGAIDCIHEASQGTPRLINIICDHALVSGFTEDKNQIDRNIVVECLKQIRLQGEDSLKVSELARQAKVPKSGQVAKKLLKIFLAILFVLFLGASAGLLWIHVVQDWFTRG
jgi:general secretion pathway protein A